MKLLRLKLDVPFRSLAAGFEVHFLREWDHERCFEFHPYCLAGRNGSGKSNVLEALAAIFYHIECIYLDYRPDGFEFDEQTNPRGFRAEDCTPDAFELEYFCLNANQVHSKPTLRVDERPVAHIRIAKVAGKPPEIHRFIQGRDRDTTYEILSRTNAKEYLPKRG